jgi:hypothetical protein
LNAPQTFGLEKTEGKAATYIINDVIESRVAKLVAPACSGSSPGSNPDITQQSQMGK